MSNTVKRSVLALLVLIWLLAAGGAFAQARQSPASQNGQSAANAPGSKVEPVFPPQNDNLVFVEGEDAVATNFDKTPILNFGTSGQRTLQLSTTEDPPGDIGYYADYVFYIEKSGDYQLWYGGTPPGPKSVSDPSYSSPFVYQIDGGDAQPVVREDVQVAGSYTPSYYWNRVADIHLEKGQHRLRFQVAEKRRYDGKYFFYLDCFFLVHKQNGILSPGQPLPALFPANIATNSTDLHFKAIEDYLIAIRDHPDQIGNYIQLSLVYSLVGDYLNALKYLNRAAVIDPKNTTVDLLKAKNLIWKGDVSNGLIAYRDLLKKDPSRLELWLEAGKVSAWSARYDESISIFTDGLKQFPHNLDLEVNLALTYLWSGQTKTALDLLDQVVKSAQGDFSRLMHLAETLVIAGSTDRAVDVYKSAIARYPRNLEAYLALERAYLAEGKQGEADAVRKQISASFVESPRLAQFLNLSEIRQSLKTQVIADYEKRLAEKPDDLALRQLLAQAYFWNGFQEKGIEEYVNILVNREYRKLIELNQNSQDLLTLLDTNYVYGYFVSQFPSELQKARAELAAKLAALESARKAEQDYAARSAAAKAKGQTLPKPAGGDPATKVAQAQQNLDTVVARTQAMLDAVSRLQDQLSTDSGSIDTVKQKEQSDEATFVKITKSNHWHWDSEQTIQELQDVQSRGVTLATFSLAKIYQIENRLGTAADLLRRIAKPTNTAPVYRYELSRALLWTGNVKAALTEEKQLPATETTFEPARKWAQAFESLAPESSQSLGISGADSGTVKQLEGDIGTSLKELTKIAGDVRSARSEMRGILYNRLVRALYQNQEDTLALHNELGGYYLNQKNLDGAIAQFRQVLAIDPWDVGAIFRLGQVYEWKGDWHQALVNYERAYYADPTYQNVIKKYNDLSRQHADSLSFSALSFSDSTRLQYEGNADYTTPISSLVGFHGQFRTDTQQLFRPPTGESPSTYQLYTFTLGVPLDIYVAKLKVEPQVGVNASNRLYDNNTGTSNSVPLGDFFQSLRAEPFVKVDSTLALGQYVYIGASYFYGRQPETFVPGRSAVYEHSADASIGTNLGFIRAYPFKYSSMRTYGQADFLSDGNIMTTATQDLTIGLLSLNNPETRLSLVGSFQYQNSKNYVPVEYYTPIGTIVAGGGIQGSTWLPVGENTIGISLNSRVSSYQEHVFDPSQLVRRLQLDGEARVEYDRGPTALWLDVAISTTYRYYSVQPDPSTGTWDYWSFSISLGYGTQMPKLLTP